MRVPSRRIRSLLSARRICVLRLDEIGDVVLTTPFLQSIRLGAPEAEITLVVADRVADLFQHAPYVDRVLPFFPREGRRSIRALRAARFGAGLRRHRFDTVIVPRPSHDDYHARLMAMLSGAPTRVGFESGKARLGSLLTHELSAATGRHEVERMLDLAERLGVVEPVRELSIPVSAADWERAADLVGSREGLTLAIAPFARAPKRNWPLSCYAEVVNALEAEGLIEAVVLIGGAADSARMASFERRLDVEAQDVTGRLELRRTAAVLQQVDMLLGADSGPAHLAAAVKTPVVTVSCHPMNGDSESPNSPTRFRPWRTPSRVVQPEEPTPPCVDQCVSDEVHCIRSIEPLQVLQEVRRLLQEHGARRTMS